MTDIALREYVCETCGRVDELTEDAAYQGGWDYPPHFGGWGIVSPRTCPHCSVDTTLWWQVAVEKRSPNELDERHRATLVRILEEAE